MRSRAVSVLLALGLLGGGGAALAASDAGPFKAGSNGKASANSQYCPPTSQQPGKPKKPGPAQCGTPQTKKKTKKKSACVRKKSKSKSKSKSRRKAKSSAKVEAYDKKAQGKKKSKCKKSKSKSKGKGKKKGKKK
jgi:hypothetical protein